MKLAMASPKIAPPPDQSAYWSRHTQDKRAERGRRDSCDDAANRLRGAQQKAAHQMAEGPRRAALKSEGPTIALRPAARYWRWQGASMQGSAGDEMDIAARVQSRPLGTRSASRLHPPSGSYGNRRQRRRALVSSCAAAFQERRSGCSRNRFRSERSAAARGPPHRFHRPADGAAPAGTGTHCRREHRPAVWPGAAFRRGRNSGRGHSWKGSPRRWDGTTCVADASAATVGGAAQATVETALAGSTTARHQARATFRWRRCSPADGAGIAVMLA